MCSQVAAAWVTDSVPESVRHVMEGLRWRQWIPKGKTVYLKVNLTHDLLLPGAITSPLVVEGLVRLLRGWCSDIALVESSQLLTDADKALARSGYPRLLTEYGVRWVNLSHGEWVPTEVELADNRYEVLLPAALHGAMIVSVPVMKTHFRCTLSGALKNLWGCLDDNRHLYHDDLPLRLAMIHKALRPALHIMDATVSMEGNGPKAGTPRVTNLVLGSRDPVALDATACTVMGFFPEAVEHLRFAQHAGLGQMDPELVEMVGDSLQGVNFHFAPAHKTVVAAFEDRLRHTGLGRMLLDGPALPLFNGIARLWYLLWYHVLAGRRRCRRILEHPLYGSQYRAG
jgi:uncharacterized protein (DUF362 family)